jgi:hypothetical protein
MGIHWWFLTPGDSLFSGRCRQAGRSWSPEANREPAPRCCWNRSRCAIKLPCSSAAELVARASVVGIGCSAALDLAVALVAAMARKPDDRPAGDGIARACILSAEEEITPENFPVSTPRSASGLAPRSSAELTRRDDARHTQSPRVSGLAGESGDSARAKNNRWRPGRSRAAAWNVAKRSFTSSGNIASKMLAVEGLS